MESKKIHYKYLDLIRVIFCLSILLYHLKFLRGGFLAVCSFFVLSGYLSCISAFRKDKFSLRDYYINRLLKIYLPVVIVVLMTIPFVSLFKDIVWLNLKPEVTSILLGYNNFWQLGANLDYFVQNINSPFMHLWYVAILLQFDLIFPFIFIIFKKIGEKFNKLFPCIIAFILAIIFSIIFYVSSLNGNMMQVYYNTFTRIFSLLFGLALGLIKSYYGTKIPKIFQKNSYSKLIFCFYLIILFGLFIFIDANSLYFEISMIAATLITCRLIDYSVIIVEKSSSKFDKIVEFVSSISYEIYLIQYPVIFLFQYVKIKEYLKIGIIFILLLVLAYILHSIFSKKIKYEIPKYIFTTALLVITLLGGYQYVIAKDYTVEMQQLEEQLAQNELIMQTKKEEYELNLKREKEDLEKSLEQIANDENKLGDVVNNLPITGIGDSVMLGAISNLYEKFPNGYFDAKISRTAFVVNDILLNLKNSNMLGSTVVLNLGTNGDCPDWCKIEIIETCEDRDIFWVNVTNDEDVHVNDKLSSFASKYDNLYIIDWNSISNGHPEYFVADGIHLTEIGKKAYVDAIYNSIYEVYLNQYKEKKETIILNYEEELKNKISFYGNDILLNIFDDINNNFNEARFNIDKSFSYESLKEKIKLEIENDLLTNRVVFVFDNTFELSSAEYQELMELCRNYEVYILSTNKKLNENILKLQYDNVTVIDFYKEIIAHDNYLMPDKLHLTVDGNKALIEALNNNIK